MDAVKVLEALKQDISAIVLENHSADEKKVFQTADKISAKIDEYIETAGGE